MKQTITTLSRNTGLSKSYISELSSGEKNNPTVKVVELLAKELKIKPVWANILKKLNQISTRHNKKVSA